jgi:hypothetical protein
MGFDGWSLLAALAALAVILLPLVLAGVLLARPARDARVELIHSQRARSTGAGATSDEKP